MDDLARTDGANRSYHGHLDEIEIALLHAGSAPAELRAELIAHISGCEDCTQRLAAHRQLEAGMPESLPGTVPGSGIPEGVQASLLAAFRRARPTMEAAFRNGLQVLSLRTPAGWLHEPNEPPAVTLSWAAAAPASSGPEELPVLCTRDGRFRVRFRRPGTEAPLRAYLLAAAGCLVGCVSLQVPSRQLLFRLGADGSADLPGVLVEDLTAGGLELRLEPETESA